MGQFTGVVTAPTMCVCVSLLLVDWPDAGPVCSVQRHLSC